MALATFIRTTAVAGLALSCASYASGQTTAPAGPGGDDWTLLREGTTTAAYVRFDSDLGIIVRCSDDRLTALITGLPEAPEGRTRQLGLAIGEPRLPPQTWYVGRDRTMVVSTFPAHFARWVREGGALNVLVPGGAEGGRNLRYVVDLPRSTEAIDQTLAACGQPPVDPRDAEIDDAEVGRIHWARVPNPSYPARRVYEWGFASISCLTRPDGRLEQCEVEAEQPQNGGFGDVTLRAMRDARVRNPDGGPIPRRKFSFVVRFQMGGDEGDGVSFGEPTRLRPTP